MTADTIGKQLAQARAAKGLTLDEAAHITKVRPDKLAALEQDDYSAFPNNTYARGFLQLYGRFLGVDVGQLANQLESANPISIQDYQYLNAELESGPDQRRRMRPRETESRRPSFAPLIVFVLLLIGAAVAVHFYMKAAQLGVLDDAKRRQAEQTAAATPESGTAPVEAVQPATTEPSAALPPPSDKDFVKPNPTLPAPTLGTTPPTTAQVPAADNELSVEPSQKTRVRIRRNDFASAPVFEDFLYPGVGPLKIKGVKFYIEVLGEGSVTLRKNGQAVAYQPPGTIIQ
jgi:cytoskeletal protein RodZ